MSEIEKRVAQLERITVVLGEEIARLKELREQLDELEVAEPITEAEQEYVRNLATPSPQLTVDDRIGRLEKVHADSAVELFRLRATLAKMQADQRTHAGSLAAISDAVAQMGQAIRNQGDALRLVLPQKPQGPAN